MKLTFESVPLQKTRDRLVSFRLAPDEFSCVVEACVDVGARSLSDFARQALLHHVEYGERSLEGDLVKIAQKLKEVDEALELTRTLIARALGKEVQVLPEPSNGGHVNGNGKGT